MRRVYNYLTTTDEYVADSLVTGTIIELSEDYGAYVAVEDRYYGLIPRNDIYSELNIGDIVHCRVAKVREDGKLTLSLRKKAYLQMDEDARVVWDMLVEAGGRFPFNDKAAPELIRSQFNMSKNEFKRAVGRLLKEKKIVINPDSIQRVDNQ
jgi:hypothetical protein